MGQREERRTEGFGGERRFQLYIYIYMGYHETGREKVKNLDNKQEAKNEEEQLKSKRDSEKK